MLAPGGRVHWPPSIDAPIRRVRRDDGSVVVLGGVVGICLASALVGRLLLVGLVFYLERRGHALTDIAQVVRAMGQRR